MEERFECDICHRELASKASLDAHRSKGVCLGKGFLCMRCLRVWPTPSELIRHQGALKKCKPRRKLVVERDEKGEVTITREV